ncbi:hypothetical protein R1flu_022620 [Riccia fluitans]|uniref:Gamma-tubulin complex component n=1 Tax=Riccia fluitans TaxID=41844 RepID=A0ABD1XPP6_9MARC
MLCRTEESDLVRDALYALQGLPSAVKKLDRLARSYNATSADKSSQNWNSLWTRCVSATALGKLLSLLADAGHLRCQLDAFVCFFLDGRLDDWGKYPHGQTKARKKKKKKNEKNAEEEETGRQQSDFPSSPVNGEPKPELLSSRCLVNQAFAAAVKTVLRGHSAALNTLTASVSVRRLHDPCAHGFKAENLRDQDPGPVIGYGSQDTTLLEFYLHTRELRVQLQALEYICLRRHGRNFVRRAVGDETSYRCSEDKPKDKPQGIGRWSHAKSDYARKNSGDTSDVEDFPRGADLLTYLYEQLMEVDPIHQELLRFLFERAYQPYSEFIRSWLFQAAVKDPYCEFVIEQSDFSRGSSSVNARRKRDFDIQPADLKLRKGVSVPRFLESVRTPLIRAGQQLQVLMKLAETCELAQQLGQNTVTSELFEGVQISSDAAGKDGKNLVNVSALVYSKRLLEETAKRRDKNMKILSQQCDQLFTQLSARRQGAENGESQITSENQPLRPMATDVEGSGLPATTDLESRNQETSSPSASIVPGNEQVEAVDVVENHQSLKEITEVSVDNCEVLPNAESGVRAAIPDRPENGEVAYTPSALAANPEETSSFYLRKKKHEVEGTTVFGGGSERRLNGHQKLFHKSPGCEPVNASLSHPTEPSMGSYVAPSSKLAKNQVQSLIADHQRGASWPVWGLPVNPFLMPESLDDFTPHFYAYTSFAGTFRPWDVTTKMSRASLNSLQKSALEESASKHAEVSVEPPWFTNLASVFRDQLFGALTVHLQQSQWEDVDHGWELEYDLLDSSSKQLGNGWKSQIGIEFTDKLADPDFLSTWNSGSVAMEDGTSLSKSSGFTEQKAVKRIEAQKDEAALLESMLNLGHLTDSTVKQLCGPELLCELRQEYPDAELSDATACKDSFRGEPTDLTEESTPSVDDSGLIVLAHELSAPHGSNEERHQREMALGEGKEARVYEGFRWEQFLRASESSYENPVREWSDSGAEGDDEEMPLSVVVDKCIIQEILSQYACVSTLTVRLFQEGLGLQDHYQALRRYFFMQQGDWAVYFVAALCQNRWGPSGNQLRQMEVQGMLEAALQRSSCEGDKYAERLHVWFRSPGLTSSSGAAAQGATKMAVAPFVDCSRLDAFDFISLEYRVDWPLTLVLTNESLLLYNMLFSFLLRIKLAVHALGDIWRRLQALDKSLHKLSHSPEFQQQRSRFRTFQQLRQQIFHLVTTVQRHVESKLLCVVWSKFLQDIQLEVKDMQELSSMHYSYLEGAANECFLSQDTKGVKGCLESIMQCVLDYLALLKGASYNEKLIDDHLFAQVSQVKKVFQSSLQLVLSSSPGQLSLCENTVAYHDGGHYSREKFSSLHRSPHGKRNNDPLEARLKIIHCRLMKGSNAGCL